MKRKIEKFLAARQARTGEPQQTEDGRLNIDHDIDAALAAVRGRDPFKPGGGGGKISDEEEDGGGAAATRKGSGKSSRGGGGGGRGQRKRNLEDVARSADALREAMGLMDFDAPPPSMAGGSLLSSPAADEAAARNGSDADDDEEHDDDEDALLDDMAGMGRMSVDGMGVGSLDDLLDEATFFNQNLHVFGSGSGKDSSVEGASAKGGGAGGVGNVKIRWATSQSLGAASGGASGEDHGSDGNSSSNSGSGGGGGGGSSSSSSSDTQDTKHQRR